MLDAGLNIGLNIGLDAGLGMYTILLLEVSCWHVSNQVEYIEHIMANRRDSVSRGPDHDHEYIHECEVEWNIT